MKTIDIVGENECCIREVAEETGMLIKFQIAYWKSMSTMNIGNGLINIFFWGGSDWYYRDEAH